MGKEDDTIILSKDKIKKPAIALPKARLVVLTGAQSGIEFVIKKEKLQLGRSGECDLVFEYPGISRIHAEITFDTVFTLRDLDSTNGVEVNGKKIERHHLENGDKIQMGELVLQFVLLD